ncbi:hypothetical protein N0V82_005759 [Gnomoniopsis sp. IMI 355080]|nr:hypothetical protein N0V82_005759 [Gnomoniopsis sp. IMI 355080]
MNQDSNDDELRDFQKRSHQSSTYLFSDLLLVQELEKLGRGWSAFVRAKDKARRDGIIATFQSRLKAEMDETAHLGLAYKDAGANPKLDEHGLPMPPGAVSLQAAEAKSREIANKRKKKKRHRPTELKQPAMKRNQDEEPFDEDFESPYVPRRTKRKNVSMRTESSWMSLRPRRNLTRPDYKKTKIQETSQSSFEPSSGSSGDSDIPSSPTPRNIFAELKPHFTEFPCRWKDCKAVLLNLETLKKHLSIVHSGEAREHLRCFWDKCGRLRTPVLFSKLSDVDSHVLERHVDEIAWRLGDGIGGVVGGPVVPDYSVNPPLRLFRKEDQTEALKKEEKGLSQREVQNADETDTESSDDDDDEDILP